MKLIFIHILYFILFCLLLWQVSENNFSYTQISSIGFIRKLNHLLLLNCLLNIILDQSFPASKKLKTKMRSTTHNNGLNHFTLWCVYQEKIIKIDIRSEAASLLPEKIRRKSDLVCHKFHNIRIDTAFNTPRKTEKKTYWVGPLKLLVKYYFIILKQHYLLNVCLLVVRNFGRITFFDFGLKTTLNAFLQSTIPQKQFNS